MSLAAALLVAPLLAACAPLVRPATFIGARDQVTDANLIGPFDGQVVDQATGEPVADAMVVGVWAYDRGDGFIGPHGSETYSTTTDAAGRYRIAPAKLSVRATALRLVSFHLVVYKRGYVGYRSDARMEGGTRPEFSVRHNRVDLRKWRETDSHAEHLLYLASPKILRKTTAWEQDLANLDLFRQHGGAGGPAAPVEAGPAPEAKAAEWLDASGVLTPDEVRTRTHYTEAFELEDLPDLARTDFYHGVHLRAQGRDEPWDIAYRVWRAPPGGMDPVVSTIQETMGAVKPTGEITPETWLLSAEGVHAVAFVDRDAQVGVLLSCGDQQCVDLDTAIILAKTLYRNLERLKSVPAPKPAAAKPGEPLTPQSPAGARMPAGAAPGSSVPAGTTGKSTAPAGTPNGAAPNGKSTAPASTTSPTDTTPAGKSTTPASTTSPTGTTPAGKSTTAPGTTPASTPPSKRGAP